jgi:DNA-binding LacI/PurR family transcriptional regulator
VVNRVVAFLCGDQIAMLQRNGIPVVAIGSAEDDDFDGLREDEYSGFFESTSHLIGVGHRRIMFMGFTHGEYVGFPPRLDGYKDAMAAAGLPVTNDLLIELKRFEGQSGSEMGFNATAWVVESGELPDAIVCSNDEVALGAMRAIHRAGFKVPDDIALAGYDDIVLAAYGAVSLTTVAQPKQELAASAVDILCKRIKGEIDTPEPQFTMIKPKLVVRESCGVNLKAAK